MTQFSISTRLLGSRNTLAAVLFVAWMLPGLLGHDPWKPDEAYSFGLVHSMFEHPSVVPMLAGEPFVEKPPLYYASAAALTALLSPSLAPHNAARLTSAVYMAIAVIFLWLTARTLFSPASAHLAVVLLLGSVGLLVRAHQLITDVALFAGFSMAVYGCARAADRPMTAGGWLGTGAGIGFMAKGLLAPGVLAIVALTMPIVGRSWRRREHVLFLGIALLTILPWMTIWPFALYRTSETLFRDWIWNNNFGRFLGTSHLGPQAEHAHYARILPWYTFPVLPLALWSIWKARFTNMSDALRLLILVFAATLVVLSASADARELYAMPLLLPLALLALPATAELDTRLNALWWRASTVFFAAIALALWVAWFALEFGAPGVLQHKLLARSPDYVPHIDVLAAAIALLYTVAWVLLVRVSANARGSGAIAWTASVTLSWALVMTLFVSWLDAAKSYRTLTIQFEQALPRSYDCIESRGLGEPQRAMLEYFAGVITYRDENPARRRRCDLLLVQQSANDAAPDGGVLIWKGERRSDPSEQFLLLRRQR